MGTAKYCAPNGAGTVITITLGVGTAPLSVTERDTAAAADASLLSAAARGV